VQHLDTGAGLRFAVLGPLRGWYDETELALGTPQQAATLSALLLRRGHPATVSQLIDAVWGDAPPRAAVETLRTYISRLRRVFDRARGDRAAGPQVESVGDGYGLSLAEDALDLLVFERLAATADAERTAGDLHGAVGHLREALQLWHGVALAGVPGPFAEQHRDRFAEMRLAALGSRVDLDLALGRHLEVTAELTALTSEYPLRERFREQLMLALYRSGRQAEALAVYQDTRRVLTDELGIDPGPELQELHRRILEADPDLSIEPTRPLVAGPTPTPAQLPADLGDFVGRQEVLAAVRHELTAARQAVTVVAVTGLGGVGKTSLAVHAGHAVRDQFPDGQLYLDLHGLSDQPVEPNDLLRCVLTTLGIPESRQPAGLIERAALYRSLLTTRRMLIVLDDAHDAEQVRWLVPGTASCAVVVTSRRRLTGIPAARTVNLDALGLDDGVALLASIVGARRVWAEADGARDLVLECGLLPLAIRILGARLAARPQWPIAAVAQRLRDDRRRFAELRTGHLAVESTFDVSYRQLSDEQVRIFRWLSLTDAASLSLPAAAALADLPEDEIEPALESLVDLNLIETCGIGEYRYHSLLREYARHRSHDADPRQLRARALGRLVDFYLASARNAHQLIEVGSDLPDDTMPTTAAGIEPVDSDTARAWLLDEYPNIIATVRQLANDHAANVDKLADLLLMLVRVGVYGANRQQLENAANRIADLAQQLGNTRAEARARYLRGRLLSERHCFDAALPALEIAVVRAMEAGDLRSWERARARQGVAHLHYGHLDVAAECFRDALDVSQRLGDRQRSAITLGNLAQLRLQRGESAAAVEIARRAYDTAEQLRDQMALMFTGYMLGRAQLDAGHVADAVELLGVALNRAEELGFRFWAGVCHVFLARARLAGARWQDTIEQAEQAIGVGRQLDDPYLECEGLIELGHALAEVRQAGRARASWLEARRLTAQFGACCIEQYTAKLADLGA